MKKVILISSHLGATGLSNILDTHSRIQRNHIFVSYVNSSVLEICTSPMHKLNNSAGFYVDELVYNYSFSSNSLYSLCKFVYVIRRPKETLNYLVQKLKYKPLMALRYYAYRLRRICEMARNTPEAVFLLWEDIAEGENYNLIEDYLRLHEKIKHSHKEYECLKLDCNVISYDLIKEAEKIYERYFYFLKNQNLSSVLKG